MSKKIKNLLLIIVIILLMIVIHLVRNYIILNNIYDEVNKFANYNDNYKLTSITYMPDEKDKIHNIHTEYVKNNILKINLEFNSEYTEDTKNLNYTSIFWKNLETNEISKITLNSDNGLLDENLVQWDENITYKSVFLWDAKLSKESYLMDNYWNNVFNFFNDKDNFYKIYQSNGNYIKIKITDKVCEIITGNENNQNLVSIEQKIELDIVSDSDIEQTDKSKTLKDNVKDPNLLSLEITKYDLLKRLK